MLTDDLGSSTKKLASKQLVQLCAGLVIAKVLRACFVSLGFDLLSGRDFPVVLYTFYLLLVSSAVIAVLQQPWIHVKTIKTTHWLGIIFYAGITVAALLFWNIGLKYYGPIKTILSSDHADVVLGIFLPALFSSKKAIHSNKLKGAVLLLIAYIFLFWTDPTPVDVVEGGAQNAWLELGPFTVAESNIGGFCLLLAVCLTLFQKRIGKRVSADIGGLQRLFSFAIPAAAGMMIPFGTFSYFTSEEGLEWGDVFSLLGVAVFTILVDFKVELELSKKLKPGLLAQTSIISSFLTLVFLEWVWGILTASFFMFVCFFLIVFGMHFSFASKKGKDEDLPTHSSQLAAGTLMKSFLRQVLEGPESRRIFFYLLLNLAFMFVETAYGFWTNSLGLISDAAHMLFDCTALFIGLWAAVIGKWEPNPVYSYGYGRVEVLSGFINGIFLVFIGFMVLMESAERFFSPVEVTTDKLLLVSTLGLLVNLVGVFAFHDLHDHSPSGGGGHSHSHGHDHGHSHGHAHKEPAKPKHGHSHGHESSSSASHNAKGVYLHILADTLGSVGVIISSLIIEFTGWNTADPICSFCISLLIFVSVIPFLQGTAGVLLQCTPEDLEEDLDKLYAKLMQIPGVIQYHSPHFWIYAKDVIVGTIHIEIAGDAEEQQVLQAVLALFKKKKVRNVTVEITKVGIQPAQIGFSTLVT